MPSFSCCEIVGHAGRDCSVHEYAGGKIVNVSVALSVWDSKAKAKRTVWTELRVFGKVAEWFRPMKGDLVHASGAEYVVDDYEGKDGETKQKHYFTAGMGSRVYFVPSAAMKAAREGVTELPLKDPPQDGPSEPTQPSAPEAKDDVPF